MIGSGHRKTSVVTIVEPCASGSGRSNCQFSHPQHVIEQTQNSSSTTPAQEHSVSTGSFSHSSQQQILHQGGTAGTTGGVIHFHTSGAPNAAYHGAGGKQGDINKVSDKGTVAQSMRPPYANNGSTEQGSAEQRHGGRQAPVTLSTESTNDEDGSMQISTSQRAAFGGSTKVLDLAGRSMHESEYLSYGFQGSAMKNQQLQNRADVIRRRGSAMGDTGHNINPQDAAQIPRQGQYITSSTMPQHHPPTYSVVDKHPHAGPNGAYSRTIQDVAAIDSHQQYIMQYPVDAAPHINPHYPAKFYETAQSARVGMLSGNARTTKSRSKSVPSVMLGSFFSPNHFLYNPSPNSTAGGTLSVPPGGCPSDLGRHTTMRGTAIGNKKLRKHSRGFSPKTSAEQWVVRENKRAQSAQGMPSHYMYAPVAERDEMLAPPPQIAPPGGYLVA